MSKAYYRTYNPWLWKPVKPETAEEKADRKSREEKARIAHEKNKAKA